MSPDVLFERKILDSVNLAKKNSVDYTSFLSDEEQDICKNILSKNDIRFSFEGGFLNAERKVCALYTDDFLPEWLHFPITALKIEIKDESASLRYSDFLGSIMGLGLKRSVVGDILIKGNIGYVSVSETVSEHIASQLCRVGRYSCSVEILADFEGLAREDNFIPVNILIPSNRLDCYIASLCNVSRENSAGMIKGGTVFINGVQCLQPTKRLTENDKLTIRGTGKFILCSDPENADNTKKGRLKIAMLKFGS